MFSPVARQQPKFCTRLPFQQAGGGGDKKKKKRKKNQGTKRGRGKLAGGKGTSAIHAGGAAGSLGGGRGSSGQQCIGFKAGATIVGAATTSTRDEVGENSLLP